MSRRLIRTFLLLSTALLAASPVSAQTKAQQIDSLLTKYYEFNLLNGSVLVAEAGEVIYKKGFGDAVMGWDIPNQPDTRFRVGSVTKQFTAAAILRLYEQGRIRLDATINDYLPEYPKAQGSHVTIHQLLTHTSGIPSYTGMPEFWQDMVRDPYEPDSFLTVFWDLDFDFEPGSQWRYNNSAYFLLGVIIEHVSGMPYDQALRELVLDPLELADTGYDHFGEILDRRAEGYTKVAGGYQRAPYLDTSLPYSAGMLYSTVEDLFKWDRSLYETGPFESRKTLDLMFESGVPTDPDTSAYYAYGWRLSTVEIGDRTIQVVQHGGSINGFQTSFWRIPADGHTIIVLDNTSSRSVEHISSKITRILYGEEAVGPKQPISDVIRSVIEAEGVATAVDDYRALKETQPEAYDFAESQLNLLAYEYLRAGDTDAAIELFKLNVEAYPDGFNTYDSLGDAYRTAGDTTQAIINYRKSLELNPDNDGGRAVLEGLVGLQLVAPRVINTDGEEYGPAFTPDGLTLFFTRRVVRDSLEDIMVAKLVDDEWTEPIVAPFSGGGYDKEPYIAPDGLKLFFASIRPIDSTVIPAKAGIEADKDVGLPDEARSRPTGEERSQDFDIWVLYRNTDGTWSDPAPLHTVNSPAYDNYPAVAGSGNLYFSSKRDSESNDLWVSRFEDGNYTEPESITELNTDWSDADPYIDADERFMIFSSTRPGGFGSGDLYITYNKDGTWSEPVNLGPSVNSDDYEYTPMLSADGEHLWFSRGWGEMYRARWHWIDSI